MDKQANVFRPGWIGSCLIGGIAAVTFWGLYGPFADAVLIGPGSGQAAPALRVGELFASLVTGIGGGKLLLGEVDRRALQNQRDTLMLAKTELSNTLQKLSHYEEKPQ